MTREEAKAMMHRGIPYPDQLRKIDMIYDDFESRTCENCDNNILDTVHDNIYGWCNEICYQVEHFKTSKDFGCAKFERKA